MPTARVHEQLERSLGRDWRQISIGELVSPNDLRFVEIDTGIEDATNVSPP